MTPQTRQTADPEYRVKDGWLHSPAFLADPYSTYKTVRERQPVLWHAPSNAWFVFRYSEVAVLLADRRCSSVRAAVPKALRQIPWLTNSDPPRHTDLRRCVTKAFAAVDDERFRRRIRDTARDLIRPLKHGARVIDLVSEFARPLALNALCALLALPIERGPEYARWAREFAGFVGGIGRGGQLDLARSAYRGFFEQVDFLGRHVAGGQKGGDLGLLAQLQRAAGLDHGEKVGLCMEMLFAAQENTANAIAIAAAALLQRPTLVRDLLDTPTKWESATEELLRFDGPVQVTVRIANSDFDLIDHRVKRGQRLALWLASANRDPAEFADADELMIGRPRNRHVAFGSGPHLCAGLALARIELQEGLRALFTDLWPFVLVDSPLAWQPNPGFRALASLRVRRRRVFEGGGTE